MGGGCRCHCSGWALYPVLGASGVWMGWRRRRFEGARSGACVDGQNVLGMVGPMRYYSTPATSACAVLHCRINRLNERAAPPAATDPCRFGCVSSPCQPATLSEVQCSWSDLALVPAKRFFLFTFFRAFPALLVCYGQGRYMGPSTCLAIVGSMYTLRRTLPLIPLAPDIIPQMPQH